MNRFILFISFFLLICSCSKDDDSSANKGSFEFTISGAASQVVSGEETNFGISNGEFFVRLTFESDELLIRIIMDPAQVGSYNVNPILVNGQAQPIEDGDAFGELGIGSTLNNDRRNFDTADGNGGIVTISSVDENEVLGSFNMSMRELLGGGGNQPEVNVQGQFTAVKQ